MDRLRDRVALSVVKENKRLTRLFSGECPGSGHNPERQPLIGCEGGHFYSTSLTRCVVPITSDAASNCQINRAVIIAMSLMHMVQMACDEVVGMIAVGDNFMSAAAAVLVTAIVTAAGVSAAALRRILGIDVELVFIHMVAMHIVHVPIVKETLMPVVR